MSVRSSVCLSRRSTAAAAAGGFAAEVGRGSRYRSIAAAAARYAGRVNIGPTARRCTSFTLIDDERFFVTFETFSLIFLRLSTF